MLRLTLHTFACLAGTTCLASAQAEVQWTEARPLTTLGSYVPELHNTALTLATAITDTAQADRTIAGASWQALALCGIGSNMRSGRHKSQLKKLMVWLTRQQTALTDNEKAPKPNRANGVLMALAFTRVGMESNYKLLNRSINASIKTWMPMFAAAGARPPTTEETALLAMLAQSLKDAAMPRLHTQVLVVAKRGAAISPTSKQRLHAAVRHYVELASGTQHPPELTLAHAWPGDALAAPLHAWLGAFAMRTQPPGARAAHWKLVQPLIAKRRPSHLWPKSGERDALTTSAMMLAVVGMSHSKASPRKAVADPIRKQKGDPWQGPIK